MSEFTCTTPSSPSLPPSSPRLVEIITQEVLAEVEPQEVLIRMITRMTTREEPQRDEIRGAKATSIAQEEEITTETIELVAEEREHQQEKASTTVQEERVEEEKH